MIGPKVAQLYPQLYLHIHRALLCLCVYKRCATWALRRAYIYMNIYIYSTYGDELMLNRCIAWRPPVSTQSQHALAWAAQFVQMPGYVCNGRQTMERQRGISRWSATRRAKNNERKQHRRRIKTVHRAPLLHTASWKCTLPTEGDISTHKKAAVKLDFALDFVLSFFPFYLIWV